MLYLDLPRPKKFGDSRRRHHLYSPEGGAAGAMDCFTPHGLGVLAIVMGSVSGDDEADTLDAAAPDRTQAASG